MSTSPKWSDFVVDRCLAAERALEYALRAGFQACGRDIEAAWPRVHDGQPAPRSIYGQWQRTLGPALDAGRVIQTKTGGYTYYTVVAHTFLPIPSSPRQFGPELEARSLRVEALVRASSERAGAMVNGRAITGAWKQQFPAEQVEPANWGRTLEPGIAAGRIRIETHNGCHFYAPSDRPDLNPPRWHSDLVRVEEAVRRASDRCGSAVLLERIRSELEADAELELDSARLMTQTLGSLVSLERVRTVRPFSREVGGRLYYALTEGPKFVRSVAEHHLDKRMRAVQSLWRATGGTPFTTRAVRMYAEQRASLRIDEDPPYAWTNALHQFERNGEIVRVQSIEARWVLWALATEWTDCPPITRANRLQRLDRRLAYSLLPPQSSAGKIVSPSEARSPEGTGHDTTERYSEDSETHVMPRGGIDTAFVSQGQNLRTLVRHAKATAGATATDTVERGILTRRPVRVSQVRDVSRQHSLLQPGRNIDFGTALREATRVRPGMVRAPIWRVGQVANYWLYDLERTPEGDRYVQYLRALWRMRWYAGTISRSIEQRLHLLEQAWEQNINRSIPVGGSILKARARLLKTEVGVRMEALRGAADATELLAAETEALECLLDRAARVKNRAEQMVGDANGAGDSLFVWTPDWVIDTTRAYAEIVGVSGLELRSVRTISSRFSLVDTLTLDEITGIESHRQQTKGRAVTTWFDRVAFALYAATRWGGAFTATVAHHAWNALGDLRDPAPVVSTLRSLEEANAHLGAAASLALMDTAVARTALLDYLSHALDRSAGDGTLAGPVIEVAAYGLGPNPFGGLATGLSTEERKTLEILTERGGERVAWLAARSLRVWESAPDDPVRYNL